MSHLLPLLVIWTIAIQNDIGVSSVNRCGPHSLFVCAAAVNRTLSYGRLEVLLPDNGQESSLEELRVAAQKCGLSSRGVQWPATMKPFARGEAAAILPIVAADGRRHFVSLIESRGDQLCIIDFPGPPRFFFSQELLSASVDHGFVSIACQPVPGSH